MLNCCNTESEYAKHQKPLLAFIQSRGISAEDAKDILQEAFIRFTECNQKGKQCEFPKSYLYKIVLNVIADHFQKQRKERMLAQEIVQATGGLWAEQKEFPCDLNQCITQYLANLSPENQTAYTLSDLDQIPQTQIAKELGLPLSTLKSRIQRTRAYLKRAFINCLQEY